MKAKNNSAEIWYEIEIFHFYRKKNNITEKIFFGILNPDFFFNFLRIFKKNRPIRKPS